MDSISATIPESSGYSFTAATRTVDPISVGRTGDYKAAKSSRFNRRPKISLRHEDDALKQKDRDRINSAQFDQQRNFAIAAWALRKHLDFVAEHNFNASTGDRGLDRAIEDRVSFWSEPEQFDIRGRFGLHDSIRTLEACRTVAGDVLLEKMTSGHIQTIESDRIRNPDKAMSPRWKNGVLLNRYGKATHFGIHERTRGGKFRFEKTLPRERVCHFGYFSRFDQARGISPMTSALHHLIQVSKGIDYALGRALISQLFGFVHKTEEPDEETEVDMTGDNGPFFAQIGLDDEIESLSDANPSAQFNDFMKHVIGIVMKSLDLNYSLYDESHTNFFGSRSALIIYLKSCRAKRRSVQSLLKMLTRWRLNFDIKNGDLVLPRGRSLDSLRKLDWIPIGIPWWNPTQEAKAAQMMIDLHMGTRQQLYRELHGKSWEDEVPKQLAKENDIIKKLEAARNA